MPPFFREFSGVSTIEDQLRGRRDALAGLLRVTWRARRAARFAWNFGVWRQDPNVGEIAIAALLHDLAETLVWVVAPDLALRIQAMQRADPTLRSRAAQETVLNVDVHALQLALAREWQLPELFVTMMDDDEARSPRVRNVAHAVDLARHSADGWENAALPDDYKMIADLLNTSEEHVREMVVPV